MRNFTILLGSAALITLSACSTSSGGNSASSSSSSGAASSGAGGGAGGGTPAPFTITALDNVRITSDSMQPNFQKAEADVDWKQGPFASVKLIVDLASTCFPFDNWQTDKPPAGQNWPADCDAFDRNFEMSLDNPVNMGDPPGLELERAITPFGGPEHLEVDITDVANGLQGKHRFRVTIPTWSDSAGKVSGSNGGWNVTAKIEVTPGTAPRKVLAVIPLFYGDQTDAMSPAPLDFTVPDGTTDARIEWRATGHGGANGGAGCIGPAEEFCHRHHLLSVDAAQVADFDAWRTDCKNNCTIAHYDPFNLDYCQQNPCGDQNSVKAPRANWCPGTETPPFMISADPLKAAGKHNFSWALSAFATGGDWRLSATYFAIGG